MGLGYAWNQMWKGNFDSAFNGLFVPDENLAAIDQASSSLDRTIQRQQAEGLIDNEQANALYAQMSPNTNSDAFWESSGPSPFDEFQTSLEESASGIARFGSGAINKTLGLGFRVIPWQVWILGLVLIMLWSYPIWKPFAAKFLSARK